MRSRRFSLFRLLLTFVGVLVLLRFSPILLRLGQAIVIGFKLYWWALLPVVICGWLIWKLKGRARFGGTSQSMFGPPEERDVTNSMKDR